MLANIYQTQSGKDYVAGRDASLSLIDFLTFSFDSVNPKVIQTSAIVFFNHLLTFKGDKSFMKGHLEKALNCINKVIIDPSVTDADALSALLLCECRILYLNKQVWEFVINSLDPHFRQNH